MDYVFPQTVRENILADALSRSPNRRTPTMPIYKITDSVNKSKLDAFSKWDSIFAMIHNRKLNSIIRRDFKSVLKIIYNIKKQTHFKSLLKTQ